MARHLIPTGKWFGHFMKTRLDFWELGVLKTKHSYSILSNYLTKCTKPEGNGIAPGLNYWGLSNCKCIHHTL